MDFSNIVTKVPAFHQSVAFPQASAADPPFLIQVYQWRKVGPSKTEKPASFLFSVSHYLATYFQLPCPQLRWCLGCEEFHSQLRFIHYNFVIICNHCNYCNLLIIVIIVIIVIY